MDEFSTTENYPYDGIFLTHAHIGHYTGLMYLGREVMGSQDVPVYAMPRMKSFLMNNGPWSQLVNLNNIEIRDLQNRQAVQLNKRLRVTPIQVPHRDEFSETVGYLIESDKTSVLFIPDIDKWGKWEDSILEWIQKIDMAFLDATFYQNGEISGRDMSEIPHPFVEESMALFNSLSEEDKSKVTLSTLTIPIRFFFPEPMKVKLLRRQDSKLPFRGKFKNSSMKKESRFAALFCIYL